MALFASLLRLKAKNDREKPSGGGGKGGRFLNPPPEEIMGATRPQSPSAKAAPLQQGIWEDGEKQASGLRRKFFFCWYCFSFWA